MRPGILATGAVLRLFVFPLALAAGPPTKSLATLFHPVSTVSKKDSPDYSFFKVATMTKDLEGQLLFAIGEDTVDCRVMDTHTHVV
jgi:hypothetical protein